MRPDQSPSPFSHMPPAAWGSHLGVPADGAAARGRRDVVGEVGGHQHRVPGGEGAGFAVAHAGVHQVGAFARAAAVAADGHVEGWQMKKDEYFPLKMHFFPSLKTPHIAL